MTVGLALALDARAQVNILAVGHVVKVDRVAAKAVTKMSVSFHERETWSLFGKDVLSGYDIDRTLNRHLVRSLSALCRFCEGLLRGLLRKVY